jgi:hypothetical protein
MALSACSGLLSVCSGHVQECSPTAQAKSSSSAPKTEIENAHVDIPMWEYLLFRRQFNCFDERDRVYGILGVLDHSLRQLIEVNYTTSVAQVYTDITRALVQTSNTLAVVRLAGLGNMNKADASPWPSWVFDWRSTEGDQRNLKQYEAQFHRFVDLQMECLRLTSRRESPKKNGRSCF